MLWVGNSLEVGTGTLTVPRHIVYGTMADYQSLSRYGYGRLMSDVDALGFILFQRIAQILFDCGRHILNCRDSRSHIYR